MLKIKRLVESAMKDTGNDRNKATVIVCDKIEEDIASGKLSIGNDISIREAFNAIVDPEGDVCNGSVEQVAEAIDSTAFPYFTQLIMAPTIKRSYNVNLGDVLSLCTQITTKKKVTKLPGYGNFYGPEMVGQGNEYPHDSGEENYSECTVHKHGHIIDFTKEMILEDEPGIVQSRAQGAGAYMGRLIHQHVIHKVANITLLTVNGEDVDTAFNYNGTGYDHFANDHSSVDGQTNDNIDTTAFGVAGLIALELLLALMKDDRGKPSPVTPTTILVPAALRRKAQMLDKSDRTFDDANNAVNVFKGAYNVVASPYLDANSSVYYYLGDFAAATYLVWRMKPEVAKQGSNAESSFTRDVVLAYKYSAEFNVGLGDYRTVGRGGS